MVESKDNSVQQLAYISYANDANVAAKFILRENAVNYERFKKNENKHVVIGVLGYEQIGKSTFLKAVTGIKFKVSQDCKKTTDGILCGSKKLNQDENEIEFIALDSEGFNSQVI